MHAAVSAADGEGEIRPKGSPSRRPALHRDPPPPPTPTLPGVCWQGQARVTQERNLIRSPTLTGRSKVIRSTSTAAPTRHNNITAQRRARGQMMGWASRSFKPATLRAGTCLCVGGCRQRDRLWSARFRMRACRAAGAAAGARQAVSKWAAGVPCGELPCTAAAPPCRCHPAR